MLNFLNGNWAYIVLLAATIIFVALWFRNFLKLKTKEKIEVLRKLAFKLFRQAEKAFGSKEGKLKFEHVFNQVYDLVPAWLRLFVPEVAIREKLQEWFNEIADYLDDGKLNNSIQQ